MPAGFNARAAAMTCASIGCPAMGCSTFGLAERMRLPSPAARMMTCRGPAMCAPAKVSCPILKGRAVSMRAMISPPSSVRPPDPLLADAPARYWQLALLWAGVPLCAFGLFHYRLWEHWHSGRFGELLIL